MVPGLQKVDDSFLGVKSAEIEENVLIVLDDALPRGWLWWRAVLLCGQIDSVRNDTNWVFQAEVSDGICFSFAQCADAGGFLEVLSFVEDECDSFFQL